MDKQEILDEISQTKLHLAYLEEKLKKCEYERWKPKDCEDYWFLSTTLLPVATVNKNGLDRDRCNSYNCFKTKEEAEQEAEKILVRRQLEDIAKRLNKGKEIDWNDDKQYKYALVFNHEDNTLCITSNLWVSAQNIYCLDENFRAVAIQEIGEDRLKKYLRGE